MKLEIKDGKVFKDGVELVEKESTNRPYKNKVIYCEIDDEKKHAFYWQFMDAVNYSSGDFEKGFRIMSSGYSSGYARAVYLNKPNKRTQVTEEEFVYEMSQRDPDKGWRLYEEEREQVFHGGDGSPLSALKTYPLPDWVGFNERSKLIWEDSQVGYEKIYNQYDKASLPDISPLMQPVPHHLIECEYKDVKAGEFFFESCFPDSRPLLKGEKVEWLFNDDGNSYKYTGQNLCEDGDTVYKVIKS